jgi:hypothetical protein
MVQAVEGEVVLTALEAVVRVYTVRGLTAQKALSLGIEVAVEALEVLLVLQEHLIQETTVVVLVAVLGSM